jgi:hypothetical protein
METTERKRPVFATIICLVTALLLAHSLYRMLPGHHAVLRPGVIEAESHAVWFRHVMAFIEVILTIGGIVALWFMRPIAATFYALQIVATVINLTVHIVFLHMLQVQRALFVNPSTHLGHPTMPYWAVQALPIMVVFLIVGIPIALFLYVWRVTSLLPRLATRDQSTS